jgi:hypothetical protein
MIAAEQIAASQAAHAPLHFHNSFLDFGIKYKSTMLRHRNKVTAKSRTNPIKAGKSEYLDTHFHCEPGRGARGDILAEKVKTHPMLADTIEEPVSSAKARAMSQQIGLKYNQFF